MMKLEALNLPPPCPHFDCSIALLKDPYRLISNICRKIDSDCFRTRLFGRPVICLQGAEAAKLFYNPELTSRQGSAPEPLKATLFGKGAIQTKDGESHRRRKSLFLSLMSRENISELNRIFLRELIHSCKRWTARKQITLYDELRPALTRSVCQWAGIPLPKEEVRMRTADLTAMFDSAVAPGLGHLRARWGRYHTEMWIQKKVQEHRSGLSPFPLESPAHRISNLTDEAGHPLTARQAAIEIINLLRPTVAISVYQTFAMHALISHPENRPRLETDRKFLFAFVQEVRRHYPFFPSVLAKARRDLEFCSYHIPSGTRLILDLYGTNHHPKIWKDPMSFRPERFLEAEPDLYSFIPQGGGDPKTNHRCPGEDPTVALMCTALEFFAHQMRFQVPEQELSVDFSRLPALPKSHLILGGIDWIPDRKSTIARWSPPHQPSSTL